MDALQLNSLIMANLPYVLLIMTLLIFIALIVFITINIKLSRMQRRYRKLMQGVEGANLEGLLHSHIEEVRRATDTVSRLTKQCDDLNIMCHNSIQHLGIVRFNAFDDTGSDLSFSIAFLDAHDNGVVLTNLFGRNESRIYAKPILKGESAYLLTIEEKEALQKALETRMQKKT